MAALGLAATLAVGLVGRVGPAAGADQAVATNRPVSLRVHEVRAGETIWSIARRVVGAQGDPRPVVDEVIAANRLHDAEIFVGQLLVVPPAP